MILYYKKRGKSEYLRMKDLGETAYAEPKGHAKTLRQKYRIWTILRKAFICTIGANRGLSL